MNVSQLGKPARKPVSQPGLTNNDTSAPTKVFFLEKVEKKKEQLLGGLES